MVRSGIPRHVKRDREASMHYGNFAARIVSPALLISALSAIHAQPVRTIIDQAAEALGGSERVRAVKNITLIGYGQYAYQFGGGNITGSPDAPQKYIAANDLRRVYDLEHGRFQQLERRNMLFPFLAAFGHNFAPNNLVLDGDIAFDINENRATRVARSSETALLLDGVHMRRMWMMNNPVVLVRRATDAGTKLSAPRTEGSDTVIDMTLQ